MNFREWTSHGFRDNHLLKISSFGKFHRTRFLYDEFHPLFFIHFDFIHVQVIEYFAMSNLILSYITRIFQEYVIHIIKIFIKRYYRAHVLTFMPTRSQDNIVAKSDMVHMMLKLEYVLPLLPNLETYYLLHCFQICLRVGVALPVLRVHITKKKFLCGLWRIWSGKNS
jgi:hypothetical protein